MNPIQLSEQLQETLVNYLTTTFDVDRDRQEPELAAFIQQSLKQPRALFAGPYLEFTPPYQQAATLEQLAVQKVISPKLLQMACFREGRPLPVDAPLYTHQAAALKKLCAEERNIVVSSGTGSGKTECFLIPILNDLLVDPTPGVRALLIYPLNALVNDQLDRLRVLLRGTNITFGRYTSELEEKAERARKQMEKEWREMEPARHDLFDTYPLPNEIIGRDQIQEQGKLPQILITNYAMLEYLLLRPQDSPLFSQGKWRFVVLDEAHTYAGAKGIEVGLLMRRLKLRLGHQPGQMRCIATSATLTGDDVGDAAAFAESLFGERFTVDDIIFGNLDHDYVPSAEVSQPATGAYVHEKFKNVIDSVRAGKWENADELALLMQEIGLIQEEDLSLADQVDPPAFLWETLRGNADLTRLRNYMADKGQPVEMATVAQELFQGRLDDAQQQQEALYHLVELAAMARPGVDKASLLPARYHLFVRPPQGIWVCLDPTCPAKKAENSWSKLFAIPREQCDACKSPVFPLVVCRTCGQVYVRLHKVGKQFFANTRLEDDAKKHYVTWRAIHENRALADEEDETEQEYDTATVSVEANPAEEANDVDVLIEQAEESRLKQKEMTLCLLCQQEVQSNGKCGCTTPSKRKVTLHLLKRSETVKKGKHSGTAESVVESLNECARCHSVAIKDTEIATEITMNALTPLAVLTEDLYSHLPESPQRELQEKPGGGRKLLSFYDSRQGAARFAAFVQDIVNQVAYRRIILQSVRALTAGGKHLPDLEKVGEACLEFALEQRVIHNDPDISEGDLPRHAQRLNQSQRERLVRHLHTQLLAEITTQLRSRQSLEALGLLTVQYFEPSNLPDFASLADELGLTPMETRTLVEYLLDDLRRGKIVTLPRGVKADHPVFGRNKFSFRLTRNDRGKYEIPWIGKVQRNSRRQLVKKVLAYKKLANDEPAITRALDAILTWLTDKSHVLDTDRPAEGYQIRYNQLFFQADAQWYRCSQCQRLSNRGNSLPCPRRYCNGNLQPIEIAEIGAANFFYENLRQEMIPMRVEEHTAQLAPDKGRAYQNLFKSGDINMLSCSTTFEMGIDLGDLQAVVMSNIPPTVANYKQRAGRAGRRASGTAFILAWAANRPHDQSYFKSPPEIIGGRVRVPYIDVHNPIITQRHVNAILFSEFSRHCANGGDYDKTVGASFDEQSVGGSYYQRLAEWIDAQRTRLLDLLRHYAIATQEQTDPTIWLNAFAQAMREKGYEYYQRVAGYYKAESLRLAHEQVRLLTEGSTVSFADDIKRYNNLLKQFRSEDCINYLSDRGLLPSYSFPLHVVELHIPLHLQQTNQLRLQRNLQLAIREYAPGQEVVADKRIWKSEALEFFGKEPQIFAYTICPTCNYLRLEPTPGRALELAQEPCPICRTEPTRGKGAQKHYVQPEGFRASSNSGHAAGQYVDRPFTRMRSALVPRAVETRALTPLLSLGYDHYGALLYVNEGVQGKGFKICPECGRYGKRAGKCEGRLNGQPCPGVLKATDELTLGFMQNTDTVHLKFSDTPHVVIPSAEQMSFWQSLKYALLLGASRALQIERGDIEGVLFPEPAQEATGAQWRQSIVLYDNVPGGAGNVKRIQDEIAGVVAAALEVIDCECETSCYRCLREYGNQWEHHHLDRTQIIDFLRVLDAKLQQMGKAEVGAALPVTAINQSAWLWEEIERTQEQLFLYADQCTLETPTIEGTTWLDLLQSLLQRGVKVRLLLNDLPDQNATSPVNMGAESKYAENLVIATHLRLLIRKGLELRQSNRQLPWIAIIDPHTPVARAVCNSDNAPVALDQKIAQQLCVINHQAAIAQIWDGAQQVEGRAVEYAELTEPSGTMVIEVKNDGKKHTEEDYFSDFYAFPVRKMVIIDRYLHNHERIVDRLGAHIALAQKGGCLERVEVKTIRKDSDQDAAIRKLIARFPTVKIKFDRDSFVPHDRTITLTRASGDKARVILGMGLDFIYPDGDVDECFLVFQHANL